MAHSFMMSIVAHTRPPPHCLINNLLEGIVVAS